VTVRDADEARDALAEGRPERLIGPRECAWLDAKGQPYQLDQRKSAAELAKDVAALANTSGGVIVIGLRTRREGSSEVIDEVRPVPATLIDRDRYRKLVRERVFPFVRDSSTWCRLLSALPAKFHGYLRSENLAEFQQQPESFRNEMISILTNWAKGNPADAHLLNMTLPD